MLEFIQQHLETNQLLTGGALLMAMGALLHQCRAIPAKAWSWVCWWSTIELDIPDRYAAFEWVSQWLAAHPYTDKRARLLSVKTAQSGANPRSDDDEGADDRGRPRIIFTPAPGRHWLFYRNRLVIVEKVRTDQASNTSVKGLGYRESYKISLITRNRTLPRQMMEDARNMAHPEAETRISIMGHDGYGSDWDTCAKRIPRPLESVVLKSGQMESMVSSIQEFRNRQQWYTSRGLPWRLGILLTGSPGSGKSSTVFALASHLKMGIAVLNLSGARLDDDGLRNLLADVPANTLVLIEDVDCVFINREGTKNKENTVTFSGLLNAIDGVAAGEGRVLFMTTNYPEKLDPALIRPGRADLHFQLDYPDSDQISRLFRRFYDSDPGPFVSALGGRQVSMAALQGHFTQYNTGVDATQNANQL